MEKGTRHTAMAGALLSLLCQVLVFLSVVTDCSEIILAAPQTEKQNVIPATDPSMHYTGRVDRDTQAMMVTFDWPCVTIQGWYEATGISMIMNGGNNEFIVFIDGTNVTRFKASNTEEVRGTISVPFELLK